MYGVKDLPEGFGKLPEVRGSGYSKMDVANQVQEMMKELRALEEAWQLKSWRREYTKPQPYRKFTLRAARTVGYEARAVMKLIKELDEKIVFMRAKLDVERDLKNWNQEWQDDQRK